MGIVVAGWIIGFALLGVSGTVFLLDYRRTGIIFRRKMPMMFVGAVGGILGVASVFAGIVLVG